MRLKNFFLRLSSVAASAALIATLIPAGYADAGVGNVFAMYRMYNRNSGEHFYTSDYDEANDLYHKGWGDEGLGWGAFDEGEPVYRLYNPNAGDHYYTRDAGERDGLVAHGWNYECVAWYSGGSIPVYCQYNPNAKTGSHNYTTSAAEDAQLVSLGWRSQGIAWYAAVEGIQKEAEYAVPVTPPVSTNPGSTPGTTVSLTEQEVYNRIISKKNEAKYAEGAPWTDATESFNKCPRQYWSRDSLTPPGHFKGKGCYGFAMEMQEYGMNYQYPVYCHAASYNNIPKIRVGDCLRVDNDGHSVIVLEVAADGHNVTVAEGNFNSSVHWGRKMDLASPSVGLVYVESFWQ